MLEEQSKSYRIKANVGQDSYLTVKLDQDYDTFNVLSMKVNGSDAYRLHNSNYGIIVGRVLANGGFGIPNAKISVFIEADTANDTNKILALYGYTDTMTTNSFGNTYNLLPNAKVDDCHQVIGAFPTKRYLLDDDTYIEVFDKYYKYTTKTNDAGDYMLFGIPTGNQKLHMDLDLSDCGILSQRPRDFVYKGYTIEQFENANQFKQASGASVNNLSQYFKQEQTVYVYPFWGDSSKGETIGITRADIDVNFKFEPTCVFIGSIVSDRGSNGLSKKCVATNTMGAMDELTAGKGTIEMIRKTPSGNIEEFEIKGNELIDGDGTWCYQIPMNLDYVVTDEYGNIVATDDPDKGIPTRTRVRFRVSMDDFENDGGGKYFRGKFLIPNNPQTYNGAKLNRCTTSEEFAKTHEEYDYDFGTYTNDESFRDLFWNNVYTVKSHIPRFQKSRSWRNNRFTGIKHCNISGDNNPMPYNSIRIKLPFMFVLMCALIKAYIRIVGFMNRIINFLTKMEMSLAGGVNGAAWLTGILLGVGAIFINSKKKLISAAQGNTYVTVSDGLCPDLENWYFAPMKGGDYCGDRFKKVDGERANLCQQTLNTVSDYDDTPDSKSIDNQNQDKVETICLTKETDYLISCIEMNLAQEYKVINFDFYNDWINGMIYMPRWFYRNARKVKFWGFFNIKLKTKGCIADGSVFGNTRYLTQQCAVDYSMINHTLTKVTTNIGCGDSTKAKKQLCHKKPGKKTKTIFGSKNGGVVVPYNTLQGQTVYYYKPCEWGYDGRKVILYATDIVLLGSLNDCSLYGIPQAFKLLSSSSYIMPTNLALTNMDEDGVLYADGNGTYCSSKGDPNYGNTNNAVTTAETSYSGTDAYYSTLSGTSSTLGDANTDTQNEGAINYADAFPVTEAAGIAWNYTGPGQGSPSGMYLPGGHFLGLSCVNSQTNIKSCINLQRICEAGASMSQRREEAREYDYDKGTAEYSYFIPTGFIANDDITSESLRNMFSSMNMNRLIATETDENTGYLKYNFSYMNSGGFDGSLNRNISSDSNYNKKMKVNDEWDNYISGQTGVEKSDSYDIDEKNNTYAKTNETNNIGYYRFRLGLNDLSTSGTDMDNRYLLGTGTTGRALPQYENSYYFYFGIKDGSTALDRLYADFFATCSKNDDSYYPVIYVDEEFDKCDNKGELTIMVTDMIGPYNVTVKNNETREILTAKFKKNVEDTGITGITFDNYTVKDDNFIIADVPSGSYEITIKDSNNATAVKKIKFGERIVSYDSDFVDINFKIESTDSKATIINNCKKTKSGYIEFPRNVIINGVEYNIDEISVDMNFNIIIENNTDKKTIKIFDVEENKKIDGEVVVEGALSGKTPYKVYLWSTGETYEVSVTFNCITESGRTTEVSVSKYTPIGYGKMDLYFGSKLLPYNTRNEDKFRLSDYKDNRTWWDSMIYSEKTVDLTVDLADDTLWALQHSIFKQYVDSAETFDVSTYCTDIYGNQIDGVLFGTPENTNSIISGKTYTENDSIYFPGYSLSEAYAVFPASGYTVNEKNPYHKMTVDYGKNVVLSDKISYLEITGFTASSEDNFVNFEIKKTAEKDVVGRAVIVHNTHNNSYIYGTIIYENEKYFIKSYKTSYVDDDFEKWQEKEFSEKLDIYYTFVYPIVYRPFYAEMDCVIWNNPTFKIDEDDYVQMLDYTTYSVNKINIHNPILYNYSLSKECTINNSNKYIENKIESFPVGYYFGDTQKVIIKKDEEIATKTYTFKQKFEKGNTNFGFYLREGNPVDAADSEENRKKMLNNINYFEDTSFNETSLYMDNLFPTQVFLDDINTKVNKITVRYISETATENEYTEYDINDTKFNTETPVYNSGTYSTRVINLDYVVYKSGNIILTKDNIEDKNYKINGEQKTFVYGDYDKLSYSYVINEDGKKVFSVYLNKQLITGVSAILMENKPLKCLTKKSIMYYDDPKIGKYFGDRDNLFKRFYYYNTNSVKNAFDNLNNFVIKSDVVYYNEINLNEQTNDFYGTKINDEKSIFKKNFFTVEDEVIVEVNVENISTSETSESNTNNTEYTGTTRIIHAICKETILAIVDNNNMIRLPYKSGDTTTQNLIFVPNAEDPEVLSDEFVISYNSNKFDGVVNTLLDKCYSGYNNTPIYFSTEIKTEHVFNCDDISYLSSGETETYKYSAVEFTLFDEFGLGKNNNPLVYVVQEEYGFVDKCKSGPNGYVGDEDVKDTIVDTENGKNKFISDLFKHNEEGDSNAFKITPDGKTKTIEVIQHKSMNKRYNLNIDSYKALTEKALLPSKDSGDNDEFNRYCLIMGSRTIVDKYNKNKINAYRIYFAQTAIEENGDRVGWL